MKTLKFIKSDNKVNQFIYYRFFALYLWLNGCKFNKSIDSYTYNVYDNLGLIDTLGSHGDKCKFTYSHSCELYFMWAIDLKFMKLEFFDY